MAALDLRRFLTGAWRIDRIIRDARRATAGRFAGEADFVLDGSELRYREAGALRLEGHTGPAHQTYRFTFPTAVRADVLFADGRFFHDLTLGPAPWSVTHLCGRDRYEGLFALDSPERWRARWRVTGPRKNLRIETIWTREARMLMV